MFEYILHWTDPARKKSGAPQRSARPNHGGSSSSIRPLVVGSRRERQERSYWTGSQAPYLGGNCTDSCYTGGRRPRTVFFVWLTRARAGPCFSCGGEVALTATQLQALSLLAPMVSKWQDATALRTWRTCQRKRRDLLRKYMSRGYSRVYRNGWRSLRQNEPEPEQSIASSWLRGTPARNSKSCSWRLAQA